MCKVVLKISMSLDGYISNQDKDKSWANDELFQSEYKKDYDDFLQTIDTIILGWNTYENVSADEPTAQWLHQDINSYVITHKKLPQDQNIIFTNEPLDTLIFKIKQQQGKNIWIAGGSSIVNQLIRKDLIDEYIITIVPTILGSGLSLFETALPSSELELISSKRYDGAVKLVYKKRAKA